MYTPPPQMPAPQMQQSTGSGVAVAQQKAQAKGPPYYKALTDAKKCLAKAKKDLQFSKVDEAMRALKEASDSLTPYVTD